MCSTFVRCRWLRGRRQQKQHYSFPISSCYPLLIQLVLSVSISLFLRISLSLSRCQPFFRMSFVTVISQCHRFNEIVLFCNRKCVILYSSSYCRFADTNRSNECKSVCQLRMITHTHIEHQIASTVFHVWNSKIVYYFYLKHLSLKQCQKCGNFVHALTY